MHSRQSQSIESRSHQPTDGAVDAGSGATPRRDGRVWVVRRMPIELGIMPKNYAGIMPRNVLGIMPNYAQNATLFRHYAEKFLKRRAWRARGRSR